MNTPIGKIYLVGAGPGDPGLLTVRGKALLERADIVVFDQLIDESLLSLAPKAEHIYAGKRPDRHPLDQAEISRLLIDQARQGLNVVRLKGGDPFVFGRGGEEAKSLAEAGVPFEIVPGVTAGIGVPAYAGIPVTHRGTSSCVTFISGSRAPGTDDGPQLDALHLTGTLVFYMGMKQLDAHMAELERLGRSVDTPAIAIEWGSTPKQRVVEGTIATLSERCAEAKLSSPTLVVVGEVVSLRESIRWLEERPLFGRRVAVTRDRRRSADLINLLHERGAEVFEFPTVEIDRVNAPDPLGDLSAYDWIVLTSVNGVDALFDSLRAEGRDARSLHGLKLCAISARTAEALADRALLVDLHPERYETEHVIARMEDLGGPMNGKRVLLPRADIGRSSLPEALRARGAEVTELEAYRTNPPKDAAALTERLVDFAPDYITFGSGASIRNFSALLGEERAAKLSNTAVFAAIGPVAKEAAAELGMDVTIIPERHRIADLVDAIVRWDGERR